MIELRFRFDAALRNLVQLGPRRVTAPFVPEPLLEVWAERPAALLTVNNLMYTEPKPMNPKSRR